MYVEENIESIFVDKKNKIVHFFDVKSKQDRVELLRLHKTNFFESSNNVSVSSRNHSFKEHKRDDGTVIENLNYFFHLFVIKDFVSGANFDHIFSYSLSVAEDLLSDIKDKFKVHKNKRIL